MQMTKSEIVRSYREAASKRNQIGILADLNACPREDIEKILKEAGVLGSSKKKAAKKEEVPRVTKAKVSRKTAEPDSSGKAETEAGGMKTGIYMYPGRYQGSSARGSTGLRTS